MATIADEDIEFTLLKSRMVSPEQIQAAKDEQALLARRGEQLSLSETLVRQGVLTDTIAGNIAEAAKNAAAPFGMESVGRFKLLKKLGEGGMGAVYLAEDTEAKIKVALKVLPEKFADDQEFVSRFRREAKAANQLRHPNIAAAYAEGEEKGLHYYAMEYCEGEALDKLHKREIHLPLDRTLDIVIQVAQGLKHAHQQGFIHRDIKPGNIFITKAGIVKILDMGLSKDLRNDEASFNTASGAVLGTAHYISPEQARGDKNVDGRADIYSLGATMYNLVTGKTPFQGATPALVMMKHLTEQLPNPQDIFENIPDSVVIVIQKMMAKEPLDRYQSCGELISDMELIRAGKVPAVELLDESKTSILRRRALASASASASAADAPTLVGQVMPVPTGRYAESKIRAGGPPAPQTKSLVPLYVAAGVAVVAAIVFVVSRMGGGDASRAMGTNPANTPAAEVKAISTAVETKPVPTSTVPPPAVVQREVVPPVPPPPVVKPDVKREVKIEPVVPPKAEKPLLASEDFEALDLDKLPAGWKITSRGAFTTVAQPERGKALRMAAGPGASLNPQLEIPLELEKVRGRKITASIMGSSPGGFRPISAQNIYAEKKPTFALYWVEASGQIFRFQLYLEIADKEWKQIQFTRAIPPDAKGASIHIEMPDAEGTAFFDDLKVDFAAENAEVTLKAPSQENRAAPEPNERRDDGVIKGIQNIFR